MSNNREQAERMVYEASNEIKRVNGFGATAAYQECAFRYAERVIELEAKLGLQKGANRAQDERERKAAAKLGMVHNCDWPDEVAERVLELEVQVKELSRGMIQSGDWRFMGKTPTELASLVYAAANTKSGDMYFVLPFSLPDKAQP